MDIRSQDYELTNLVSEVRNVDMVLVLSEDVSLYGCPGIHLGIPADLLHYVDLNALSLSVIAIVSVISSKTTSVYLLVFF